MQNFRQCIKWVDSDSGKIIGSFSKAGKMDGEIYFPRCMRRCQDSLLVMDKTGRFQKFAKSGEFIEVAAKIDDFIGNGFTIREGEAVIACSGIVKDQVGQLIYLNLIFYLRMAKLFVMIGLRLFI